jgi:hypothetical protein
LENSPYPVQIAIPSSKFKGRDDVEAHQLWENNSRKS